jgi:hypothetical protein
VLGVHPCEDGLAKVDVGSRRSGGSGLRAAYRTIPIGALAASRGLRARRQSILSRPGTARAFWHGHAVPGRHQSKENACRRLLFSLSRIGALLAQSQHRDTLAHCFAFGGKRAKKGMLALAILISLAYREKRWHADSCDGPLTSTHTTKISATGGSAFNLASSSSA